MSKKVAHLYNSLFNYLQAFKEEQDPSLTFSLRKNDNNARLSQGYWFQGTEKYIFIPFYKKGDSKNKTKTIGFVIALDKEGDPAKIYLEIVYKAETDPIVIQFYDELLEGLDRMGFKFKNKQNQRWQHIFPTLDVNVHLKSVLEDIKPTIDQLIKKHNLEDDFFISDREFEKMVERVETIKKNGIVDAPLDQAIKKVGVPTFWLYAPGENASLWEEFYENKIMGLGWEKLGDLNKLGDKKAITKDIQEIYKTQSASYNNALANLEFRDEIAIGDIVICKKGRSEYLGYGIVTSDYYYDSNRATYKSCRKVDWKKKGVWETDYKIVLKTLTNISKYPDYVDQLVKLIGIETGIKSDKKSAMTFPLNTILYGPPGTGKTHHTLLRAAEIVTQSTITNYEEAQAIFQKHFGKQIEFITFHQNYSYEDFIQGLRPDIDNGTELTFERKDGIFKRIADRALENLKQSKGTETAKKPFIEVFNEFVSPLMEGEVEELAIEMKRLPYFITDIGDKSIAFRKPSGGTAHTLSIATLKRMYGVESVGDIQGLAAYYDPLLKVLLEKGRQTGEAPKVEERNYVLIIDEINRANISRVFGELITLIEPDKRSHGANPLRTILPSGEEFTVPSNLYLIGTMNTADKSIALLDIALRRRFEFEAMYPKYEIEGHVVHDVAILQSINKEIILKKGHDFQIGHSFFMGDDYNLIDHMNKKVIPLLLEYFMNDDKEVKKILEGAKLTIDEQAWPLKITGKQ